MCIILFPYFFSHILKVPFENSGGSGIVYIWIGSEATQEEAIHAEQMGRGMFEVGGAPCKHNIIATLYIALVIFVIFFGMVNLLQCCCA